MWSIELRHFQRPWTSPNSGFKVTPFFYAKYLTNGWRYGHSCYKMQIENCTQAFEWCHFERPWLSEIFNDTKHRVASLRQLSFLFLFPSTHLQLTLALTKSACFCISALQSLFGAFSAVLCLMPDDIIEPQSGQARLQRVCEVFFSGFANWDESDVHSTLSPWRHSCTPLSRRASITVTLY